MTPNDTPPTAGADAATAKDADEFIGGFLRRVCSDCDPSAVVSVDRRAVEWLRIADHLDELRAARAAMAMIREARHRDSWARQDLNEFMRIVDTALAEAHDAGGKAGAT